MLQRIGQHIDTILFLAVGVTCLVLARKAGSKKPDRESAAKEKRLLTFGGALLVLAGIGRLLM
jgi:hypothetical protein